MITKTIKYIDYAGVERVESFDFNLTQFEIVELEASYAGGLTGYIERIVKEEDTNKIIPLIKKLVLMSYGIRSEDGKKFIKKTELAEEFSQTEAFNDLVIGFLQNPDEFSQFVAGLNTRITKVREAAKLPTQAELVNNA